jgi:hypothetical protein
VVAGEFTWRDAPEGRQRSVRELAASLEADWPALGLSHEARPPAYAYTPSSHALSCASRWAPSTPSTNRCALIPTTLP